MTGSGGRIRTADLPGMSRSLSPTELRRQSSGAGGGTRTPTGESPLEPESSVSTNSTTPAQPPINIPCAKGSLSRGFGGCSKIPFPLPN